MPPLERILCAEDDADIRTVLQIALEMIGGYTLQLCDTGQAVLAAIAEFKPDLILLDVRMPAMDGPSTLHALRTLPLASSIPIIFMTASVQPAEVAGFMALGALAVIAKPFDPMTLAGEIENYWQQQ